jgi:hypothetical protein
MGTSAVIKVEGVDFAEVYKHFDGYPEDTLPWLIKFNERFVEIRGVDSEYKFAQLLRSSVEMQEEFNLDASLDTGWGVSKCGENYTGYTYKLMNDGTVTVNGKIMTMEDL